MRGLEPPTFGLGGRCSTIELHELPTIIHTTLYLCNCFNSQNMKKSNLIHIQTFWNYALLSTLLLIVNPVYKLLLLIYLHLNSKPLQVPYIMQSFHSSIQICLKSQIEAKAWINAPFLTVYLCQLANEYFRKPIRNFGQKNLFHTALQSIVANLINMLFHRKLKMANSTQFCHHLYLQFD